MKNLRAFTLPDVLIGMMLLSLMVIMLTIFTRDTAQYLSFVHRHRQLRREAFALANTIVPTIIRAASALDYANTTEHQLSLFVDREEKKIVLLQLQSDPEEDRSQLVMISEEGQEVFHSQNTVIDLFRIEITKKPNLDPSLLQSQRAYQPRVRFRIEAHGRTKEGSRGRKQKTFFDDPRISYESLVTLRNYSFSSLRAP